MHNGAKRKLRILERENFYLGLCFIRDYILPFLGTEDRSNLCVKKIAHAAVWKKVENSMSECRWLSRETTAVIQIPATQSMVCGPAALASLGYLLECRMSGPTPDLLNQSAF